MVDDSAVGDGEGEEDVVQPGHAQRQLVGLDAGRVQLAEHCGQQDRIVDGALISPVPVSTPTEAPVRSRRSVVGSSRNSTCGRPTRLAARSTLRRMPPEWPWPSRRPGSGPAACRSAPRFAVPVRSSSSGAYWPVSPIRPRTASATSWPSTLARPRSVRSRATCPLPRSLADRECPPSRCQPAHSALPAVDGGWQLLVSRRHRGPDQHRGPGACVSGFGHVRWPAAG